jgi:hypothetical protein
MELSFQLCAYESIYEWSSIKHVKRLRRDDERISYYVKMYDNAASRYRKLPYRFRI